MYKYYIIKLKYYIKINFFIYFFIYKISLLHLYMQKYMLKEKTFYCIEKKKFYKFYMSYKFKCKKNINYIYSNLYLYLIIFIFSL